MTDNGSQADATADQSAEKFPLRLRVHALARTLGLTSKQVLVHLQEMGVTARTAQSSISRADAEAVELRISGAAEQEPATEREPATEQNTPAAEAASPAATLFSAAESAPPQAAVRGEATAPLFLSPDTDAAGSGAGGSDAAGSAPKKSAKKSGKKASAKKADADSSGADEKTDKAEKVDKVDKAEKSEKAAKKAGKKSGGKKAKKAAADATEADSQAADVSEAADVSDADATGTAETAATESTPVESPAADSTEKAGADNNSDNNGADNDDSDHNDGEHGEGRSRRRRRGRRGRGRGRGDQGSDNTDGDDTADGSSAASESGAADSPAAEATESADGAADEKSDQNEQGPSAGDVAGDGNDAVPSSKRRRRRRRRRGGSDGDDSSSQDDPPNTVVHEREPRSKRVRDEVQGISGSTRLEAKRQRRRDGRDAGRRRPPILTESEFLARRESVERVMVVRERAANAAINDAAHGAPTEDYTQIAVLEDGVLVEHFVTTETSQSMVGNIYLGRVQNVLPGMEAAFVDIGRGRNGVLYAGEVNWEAAGLDGGSRKIEQALKPGDYVLVQVSKDPIGHKGARLTTQISLAGRYLVYVPGGTSTGISRKLPDTERKRLKQILAKLVPDEAGVIIRTASEGVSAEDLGADIERLEAQWKSIEAASEEHKSKAPGTPKALYEEPDLLVRVVRDLFNEDFRKLVVEGDRAWSQVSGYVSDVAPDLSERLEEFTKEHADAPDSFAVHRIDEQLAKALDRKVWLPSGGTLIIEHTEAMTVVDVNTGKFTGSGGNLEETVTRNNLEAAEEIVRQMRLRDIGGMIIVDFIDMVLESNRDLVLRRLTEALARDRTRHQVSEVTSLGLVQMTRKRLGTGLLEAFSTTCTACSGRGVIVHANPIEVRPTDDSNRGGGDSGSRRSRRSRRRGGDQHSGQQSSQHDHQHGHSQADAQPKAPHKPAADHPLFRAMAHGEPPEHGAADDAVTAKPVDAKTSDAETSDAKTGDAKTEPKAADQKSVEATEPAESTRPAESTKPVEQAAAPEQAAPAVVTRRRRRAVRRTAAPTPVETSANTDAEAAESAVEHRPTTTVAPQSTEPIVAVKRSSRRRTGRRVAGPPVDGE